MLIILSNKLRLLASSKLNLQIQPRPYFLVLDFSNKQWTLIQVKVLMKFVCNKEPNRNAMIKMPLMTLGGSRQIVRLAYGVINFLWRS